MKKSKRIFVMPDTHFGPDDGNGGHDEAAFATCLRALSIVRPDEFIHIGDVGEWASCSSWEYQRKKRPPIDYVLARLRDESEAVNACLDRIDDVLDEAGVGRRVILEGNHEAWIRQAMAEADLYEKTYTPEGMMRLKERGYRFIPYGQYYQRGKLSLYHGGHYTSIHHAYQHALKCGASVGYGHSHDVQYVTVPSLEGPHLGVSFGCLCKLEKRFLRGRQTNWQHAFGVIHLQANGDFMVEIHRIENGWTVVNGREIQDGKLLAGRPRKETV